MVNKIGSWRGSVPATAPTREADGLCRQKQKEEELHKREGGGGPLPFRSRALASLTCPQSYSFTFTKWWFPLFPPCNTLLWRQPEGTVFMQGLLCSHPVCLLSVPHAWPNILFLGLKAKHYKTQCYVSSESFLAWLLQGCWCRHERSSGCGWSIIRAPIYASYETAPRWLGLPLVFLWLLIYTVLW